MHITTTLLELLNRSELTDRLRVPYHVVQLPCWPCNTALNLYCSCPVLVTSATTMAFPSFLVALDQKRGASPQPSLARLYCSSNLLVSQAANGLVYLHVYHFWPVRVGTSAHLIGQWTLLAPGLILPSPACGPGLWIRSTAGASSPQTGLCQRSIMVVPTIFGL